MLYHRNMSLVTTLLYFFYLLQSISHIPGNIFESHGKKVKFEKEQSAQRIKHNSFFDIQHTVYTGKSK